MKIPLFDFDGILFKAISNSHFDAMNYVFHHFYHTNASFDDIAHWGMTDKQIVIEILASHEVDRDVTRGKFDQAKKVMIDYFLKNAKAEEYKVLPGVKELLFSLKENEIPIGALTGNTEEIAWEKLRLSGIIDYFDFGAFGDTTEKRSELVAIAKERADKKFKTDFPLESFVIIGDTPRDIICAREAKISVISSSTGNHPFEELKKFSPNLLVHSLEEKDKIIDFLSK